MNSRRRTFLLGLGAFAQAAAWEREPPAIYAKRRKSLAEAVGGGLIVVLGYDDSEGRSGYSSFRQESHFYYLTGHNEPGAALAVAPESGRQPYREILFLPENDAYASKWLGPRLGIDGAAKLGVEEVLSASAMESRMRALLRDRKKLYGLLPTGRGRGRNAAERLLARLQALCRRKDVRDVRAPLARLRAIKSAGEIATIQKAADASIEAHLAAWRVIRPGVTELQVAGAMVGAAMTAGCERMAYPPIVGSGLNSTILHYDRNDAALAAGGVVLMDVGGEYSRYAADVTRTVPTGGAFSSRQRRIYDLVLDAQRLAIAAVKPGARLHDRGPDGLTGIVERRFEQSGEPGSAPRLAHGLGHHVGLDVHDPRPPEDALQPGMVVTIEPGLYLPAEGFGVRIEDMAVVTDDGCRLMTARLPREADAVEAALAA